MDDNLQIQKGSNLEVASFVDFNNKLTDGQKWLLELLSTRIKEKQPITKEDIIEVYFKTCAKNGTIRYREGLTSRLDWRQVNCMQLTKEDKFAEKLAVMWFQNNLGRCITKGKLLVIPIIEI